MEAAPSTDRSYCTTCGWLLPAGARATCAACGGDATPLPLVDNTRPLPREDEEDDASFAGAKEAWSFGDHARAIGLALTFGGSPRAFTSPLGPGWVAAIDATPVFAILDVASSQVTLEIPIVRLPQTRRVPALRVALALCNSNASTARFCLRLDLLIVRYAARLDLLSPAALRRAAREIAAHAGRAQGLLASSCDARPAIPEQGVLAAWDRLGRSQALPALAPASHAPPPSSVSARPSAHPSSRPSTPNMMAGIPPRPITLRLSIPPSLAQDADDDLPAVLSPDFADDGPGPASVAPASHAPPSYAPPNHVTPNHVTPTQAPTPRAAPTIPPPPSRPAEPAPAPPPRPSMFPSALPTVPALGLRAPFPSTSAMRAVVPAMASAPSPSPSAPASAADTGEMAPPSRRANRPPPQDAATPEGRLCELLRQALALATALSFEEKPHAMLLLVRAAVFRAVMEHHEAVPNAVFYLVRATRQVTREIWSTRPEPGRAPPPMPVAEPALGALEQVVAARAHVPKEKPASVEPWTTATQAKENLARFVVEIELSPPDPTLRHYLALGALSELMCRTRLPGPTEQRLRDIVAYAQRDGAKPQVIELMMTALRKIVSG